MFIDILFLIEIKSNIEFITQIKNYIHFSNWFQQTSPGVATTTFIMRKNI